LSRKNLLQILASFYNLNKTTFYITKINCKITSKRNVKKIYILNFKFILKYFILLIILLLKTIVGSILQIEPFCLEFKLQMYSKQHGSDYKSEPTIVLLYYFFYCILV